MGDAADFIPVFLSAKHKGLKVASHLAEVQLVENDFIPLPSFFFLSLQSLVGDR